MKQKIGHVAVDSGQVMVGDPCYLDDFKTHGNSGALDLEENLPRTDFPYSYEGACNASMNMDRGGQLVAPIKGAINGTYEAGVSVSSGYGDGVYPVYAEYNADGRVARITVEFD